MVSLHYDLIEAKTFEERITCRRNNLKAKENISTLKKQKNKTKQKNKNKKQKKQEKAYIYKGVIKNFQGRMRTDPWIVQGEMSS